MAICESPGIDARNFGECTKPFMPTLKFKAPLRTVLGSFWSILSILLFLEPSVVVFVPPRFPLAIGVFHTAGRTGLPRFALPKQTKTRGLNTRRSKRGL